MSAAMKRCVVLALLVAHVRADMYDQESYNRLYELDHPSHVDQYGASTSALDPLEFAYGADGDYTSAAHGDTDQYYGNEFDEYYEEFGLFGDDDYGLDPAEGMRGDCIESEPNKANITSASTLQAPAFAPCYSVPLHTLTCLLTALQRWLATC